MLSIMVVNRHPGEGMKAAINIKGFSLGASARVFQIAHIKEFGDVSDWYGKPAYDSLGKRERRTLPAFWCTPKLRKVPYTQVEELVSIALSEEFLYEFPPHSFTVIVCELN